MRKLVILLVLLFGLLSNGMCQTLPSQAPWVAYFQPVNLNQQPLPNRLVKLQMYGLWENISNAPIVTDLIPVYTDSSGWLYFTNPPIGNFIATIAAPPNQTVLYFTVSNTLAGNLLIAQFSNYPTNNTNWAVAQLSINNVSGSFSGLSGTFAGGVLNLTSTNITGGGGSGTNTYAVFTNSGNGAFGSNLTVGGNVTAVSNLNATNLFISNNASIGGILFGGVVMLTNNLIVDGSIVGYGLINGSNLYEAGNPVVTNGESGVTFTGTFLGNATTATSASNLVSGVSATNFTIVSGSVPLAALPAAVVTNNQTNVTLGGNFNNVFNAVTMFGAKGDGGVTDNTAAFQAAINYANQTNHGGTIYIPLATNRYVYKGQLTNYYMAGSFDGYPIKFVGDGAASFGGLFQGNAGFSNNFPGGTVIDWEPTNTLYTIGFVNAGNTTVEMSSLTWMGEENTSTNSYPLMFFAGQPNLHNCYFESTNGTSKTCATIMYLGNPTNGGVAQTGRTNDCFNGYPGIVANNSFGPCFCGVHTGTYGANIQLFGDDFFNNCGYACIILDGSGTIGGNQSQDVYIANCAFQLGQPYAIVLTNQLNPCIITCAFVDGAANEIAGVYVDTYTYGLHTFGNVHSPSSGQPFLSGFAYSANNIGLYLDGSNPWFETISNLVNVVGSGGFSFAATADEQFSLGSGGEFVMQPQNDGHTMNMFAYGGSGTLNLNLEMPLIFSGTNGPQGNGGGLTNLTAANLVGSVPSVSLTSVPSSSLTGNVPIAALTNATTNYFSLLGNTNYFSGASNTFSAPVYFQSPIQFGNMTLGQSGQSNTFSGIVSYSLGANATVTASNITASNFTGNASGLTNIVVTSNNIAGTRTLCFGQLYGVTASGVQYFPLTGMVGAAASGGNVSTNWAIFIPGVSVWTNLYTSSYQVAGANTIAYTLMTNSVSSVTAANIQTAIQNLAASALTCTVSSGNPIAIDVTHAVCLTNGVVCMKANASTSITTLITGSVNF